MRWSLIVAMPLLVLPAWGASAHPPELPLGEPQPTAYCIVVISPLDGFRQVRITVDEELTQAQREESWRMADADGDGTVDSSEAQAFQDATAHYWPKGLGMGNESLSLSARSYGSGASYTETQYKEVRPVYAMTWRHLGHGFYEDSVSTHSGQSKEAPTSEGAFETQKVREYAFNVADDAKSVTVYGADERRLLGLNDSVAIQYQSNVVEEYVVVLAPPGWTLSYVHGQNYTGQFTRSGPAARIDIAGFDTAAPFTIEYVKGDPPGPAFPPFPPSPAPPVPRTTHASPAAGVLTGLALLLGAVAARSRRVAIP